MCLQVAADGGLVERLDAQAEVVEVAPLAPGRHTAGAAQRTVHRHQVDQRAAGAQLHQADVVLPTATPVERDGTYVNVDWRVQRFESAFPAPAQVRPALDVLADLLARIDPQWSTVTAASVFDLLSEDLDEFQGLRFSAIPPHGAPLSRPGAATKEA